MRPDCVNLFCCAGHWMEKDKTIRRRNPEKTRARLIEVAQKAFSERGYAQTGLRDIAKLADVSSSLPVLYFSTKAGLFEAALENALDIDTIVSGEKKDFGKRLVQAVLDPDMPMLFPAMIALSIGDDEASIVASRFAREQIIKPMAKWLGAPHGRARAYLVLMISTGFVIYNRHILVDDSKGGGALVTRWLENAIQAIVDGSEETIKGYLQNRS
jgi:AcrR family transcriptional regulator